MTDDSIDGSEDMEDRTVAITVRIDRDMHAAMQAFFASGDIFPSYDELIETVLQAATCRTGNPRQLSFLDLVVFSAWQRGEGFEATLFGRTGNEHDRRQLYSLMLGYHRLDLVNSYEQREFRDKGAATFAHDVAMRFARDLDRTDATSLIETMTVGSPALREEMLHWLDIGLASRG